VTSGQILALNHVGVSVANMPRARSFWTDGLGAVDHGGWSWPVGTKPSDDSLATEGTSAEALLLRTDTAFMEIFAFATPTPQPRASDAPGITALTWAVDDIEAVRRRAVAAGGVVTADGVCCPDGTPVRLVAAPGGPYGLVGVEVRVADPAVHVVQDVPGPVALALVGGAGESRPRPIDLGANHICLDVDGIADVRAALEGMSWHHEITESSGGVAAVSYGTTADGVVVELLESRSEQAFFSRCRLAHPGT
jgi:catechol 2,3-dioxygenase-like lactoylglutathione lyase family enzyme